MQVGFISDNLEIKFLILYIAARVIEPVPFEVLQDLAMCDAGVDYFDFSACLADLVRTEHLSLEGERYAITKKGRDNSAICESSLPYSVRMQVEKNIAQHNQRLRRNALVTASTTPREKGGYTLTLSGSRIVTSAQQVTPGECLRTRFHDGTVRSRVLPDEKQP